MGKHAQFLIILAATGFLSYVLWRQMKRVEVAAGGTTAAPGALPSGGGTIAQDVLGLLTAGANLTTSIIGQSAPKTN